MVLAMVIVGCTVVASDIIGGGMSPFQGTALRFAIANAGIVIGTLPAMIAVLAFLAFGERLGGVRIAAISLATLSVLIVTLAPNTNERVNDSSHFLGSVVEIDWRVVMGTLIILLAVLCEALFLTLNRTLRTPVPAFQIASLMCGFGVVLSGLRALVEWFEAARGTASDAALAAAMMPIAAIGLSVIVLGDTVSTLQVGGCGLVVLSILIGTFGDRVRRA